MELDDIQKPIIVLDDGTTLFYKSINNITLLAVSKENINATVVFAFFYQ